MADHNLLGKAGEHEAVEFLVRQGFTVRETNWRMGKLEIDIIAAYLYQQGTLKAGLTHDKQLKEAVRLLNSPAEYAKLLKVQKR